MGMACWCGGVGFIYSYAVLCFVERTSHVMEVQLFYAVPNLEDNLPQTDEDVAVRIARCGHSVCVARP
jgi:hypothetical protein